MDLNTTLGIAGLVFGIVSLVTGYIFYRRGLRTKEPCYSIKTETLIAGYSAKFKDLTIHYKDKEIENLSVSKIAFWNNGSETINLDDIAPKAPLLIVVDKEAEILDAKVLEQTNLSSDFSLHLLDNGKYAQILFDFIDKRQGAVFQVIHTGTYPDTNLTIWGHIKGAEGISRKLTEKTPLVGWIMTSFSLSMLWILVLMFIYTGITRGFESILVPGLFYALTVVAVILTIVVARTLIIEMKHNAKVPKGLKSYKGGKE